MIPIGTTFTFESPYHHGPTPPDPMTDEEFAVRKGTPAEVIAYLSEANGPHEGWDDEALPVYRIRFTADAREIIAWPEEVEPDLIAGWKS